MTFNFNNRSAPVLLGYKNVCMLAGSTKPNVVLQVHEFRIFTNQQNVKITSGAYNML